MRVLVVSSDIGFFNPQGGGDVLDRHIAYANGCEKLIVLVKAPKNKYSFKIIGNLIIIPSGGSGSLSIFLSLLKKAIKAVLDYKIDVVNTQDPMIYGIVGYFLKLRFGVPLIVNWHGDFLNNNYWINERLINRPLLIIGKFISRRADCVRVVSPVIKEKLKTIGVDEEKVFVIPTPVDLEKFKIKNKESKKSNPNEKKIIFVGRLVKLKNIDFLLRVIKKLANDIDKVRLVIVGDGPETNSLKEYSKKLDIQKLISFVGLVPHGVLMDYYSTALIAVLPSLHESFGKVIIEAAMAGVPTLASRTTGAVSIIKDERLLFDINDEATCVSKLKTLLENETLRTTLLKDLIKNIEDKFGWDKSVNTIINMWQRAVIKNRR
ncbi:glycosyltransferase family 1 protein [Candidatus Parcubacteria bacterium]|nr:MAG: glycosyltransferase family 1 protein [Candidatus Parcubacteria bacterium]